VEGVDGFFAALACSSIRTKQSEWMTIVWGGEAPAQMNAGEVQEATGLLMRMWNQVTQSIKDGSFAPLMSSGTDDDGNEVMLPHVWCMGFLEGMRVRNS
jgi:yecA family protein